MRLILSAAIVMGLSMGVLGTPQDPSNRAAPQPTVRIVPPSGATFAPGQHFDVRLEANDLRGTPKEFSLALNGRDLSRDIFGAEQFNTFQLLDAEGNASQRLGGGITRRSWSVRAPGHYELTATLVDADGARVTAKSSIDVLAIRAESRRARNIILFIGDGMGVAQRTAARIVSRGVRDGKAQGLLAIDTMAVNGFVMTSSMDSLVTDSSPGAASLGTGNKSVNNAHGVFTDNTGPSAGDGTVFPAAGPGAIPNTNPTIARLLMDNPRVENIAELMQRTRRMSTGVVSTVAVTDSTPGSFSSHTYSRYAQAAIAEQIIAASGHRVIMGAGTRFFVPAGDALLGNITSARADTRNLVEEAKKAGYTVVSNAAELQKTGTPQKLLGLFHPTDMTARFDRMGARRGDPNCKEAVGMFPDQPDLEVMTKRAIDVLSQDGNGFFLMVEGGSIDREYHRMDPGRAVYETIELDKAVGVASAWARQRGDDTLILVTADHETSGLALTGVGGRGAARAFPDYTDADHDGFPDSLLPPRPLAFDFASRNNPLGGNHYYEVPRNLRDLNPTSALAAATQPASGHTAVDVFIAASGPGSQLLGGVMDNTDVFFRMLRAVGYK